MINLQLPSSVPKYTGPKLDHHCACWLLWRHNGRCGVVSQITSLTIVYLIVHPGGDQRRRQSSASLAFVRGLHRWPVNSPHKWPVTRKMLPFDDVIMWWLRILRWQVINRHSADWKVSILPSKFISSLLEQNVRHFADDIFRCIFVNEKFCILIKISQ